MMRRRSLQRATAITASALLLVCGAGVARAQVNGNQTISGSAFGQPLTVGTSSQFAGSVTSIKWANKEFINNWDHGRQLQQNSQFFNRFECYNPYEAGSFYDGTGPTSTSQLLSMSASGNSLKSTVQMAWYLDKRDSNEPLDYCGDPAQRLPAPPYTGPLSDFKLHKTVTIGFKGIPNVIEYLTELEFPPNDPVHLKGLNHVTAVTPYDFSVVGSYDVVSKDYRKIRALSGEDDRIKIVSTPDSNYALGFYAPELLQPYGDPGTANFWFVVPPTPIFPDVDFPCVHVGSVNRYDSLTPPGSTHDRAYLVVGNLAQVKEGLTNVHLQFRALDPEVYNWREYIAINGLSPSTTQAAAQNHWLTQGIPQGLTGSRIFSASQYLQLNPDLTNAFGPTNYLAAIDHYVGSGRDEGRSTAAKPAAGMQHLLVFANRNVKASGQDAFGQLGSATSPSPPTHITSLDNAVTEVAAGDYTSFAVKTDGTLWVWGSNQYGARGDGSSGDNIGSPVQVPIPNRITTPNRRGKHAVAVGAGVYAAVDTEGQVWTWGTNWNGRLGDGSPIPRYTPGRVVKSAIPGDYLTGIVSISAGGGTVAALDADGTVWTWGAGADGALGNGFTDDSGYPVQVRQAGSNAPLVGITEVACGSSGFCIALARYGIVFGWGSNDFSQMGSSGNFRSLAAPIDGMPGSIEAIAAGSAHAIALSRNGNVYGWGYNGRGQLGAGFTSVGQSPVVMQTGPDGMNNISDLAAAGNFSIMVRNSDRAVFVAGDNQSGQLGVSGNQSAESVPRRSSY